MVETFTRKKVSSLTLGEKLTKFRTEARLTVADVAKATKIQAKYVDALEQGRYEKLPADVYVRGYLRSYARYLNIDEGGLVRLYEQERNITETLRPEAPKKNVFADTTKSTYVITPRLLALGGIVLAIGAAAIYLIIQFRQFTTEPFLTITEPNPNTVLNNKTVMLRGKTDRGAQVVINNEATFVSPEGNFEEELTLQNGINQVTIRAVNRFDKEKIETLQLEARFEEAKTLSSEDLALQRAASEGVFRIAVSIKETPTEVTITADGKEVFRGVFGTGDPRIFEAKEKIIVTTQDGSQVLVKTEAEKEAVALGEKEKIPVTKTFDAPSKGGLNEGISPAVSGSTSPEQGNQAILSNERIEQ